MASFNSIRQQVANLHKNWSDDEINTLAEDLYQDAIEKESEDMYDYENYEDDYEEDQEEEDFEED